MATNRLSTAEVLELTAPSGGVVSGTLKLIGSLLVVPLVSAAEGVKFACMDTGVWLLPKTTGVAWTEGAKLYWNAGTSKFSTVGADGPLMGIAMVDAASGDATGYVKLQGGAAPEEGEGAQAAIVSLTDNSAGAADNTVEALPNPTDAPGTADALRDDLVAVFIPALRNNVADLTAKVNAILAVMRTKGDILP